MNKVIFSLILLGGICMLGCRKDSNSSPSARTFELSNKLLGKWKKVSTVTESGGQINTINHARDTLEFKSDGTSVLKLENPDPHFGTLSSSNYSVKSETTFAFENVNWGTADRTVSRVDEHTLIYFSVSDAVKTTYNLSR